MFLCVLLGVLLVLLRLRRLAQKARLSTQIDLLLLSLLAPYVLFELDENPLECMKVFVVVLNVCISMSFFFPVDLRRSAGGLGGSRVTLTCLKVRLFGLGFWGFLEARVVGIAEPCGLLLSLTHARLVSAWPRDGLPRMLSTVPWSSSVWFKLLALSTLEFPLDLLS